MGHRTTQPSEALGKVLARQRRLLLASWTRAAGGEVRAIHRARVASRRLREALTIAAAAGDGGAADRARRAARRVTRALGPVREIDVALAELDPMAVKYGWPAGAVAAVRRALERTRSDRFATMRRAMAAAGRSTVRRRAGRAADALAHATGAGLQVRAVQDHLRRRADRVGAQAALCGTLYAVDRLHTLRIAVKKLRYTLEIIEPAAGAGARAAIRILKATQQRLGRLHDVQVLMGAVQSLAAGEPQRARGDWPAILDDLERECRERHAHIVTRLAGLERGVQSLTHEVSLLPAPGRRAMIKSSARARGRRSTAGLRSAVRRTA